MKILNSTLCGALAGLLLLAGCYTERDQGEAYRATLKPGQSVSPDMDGWVAVPNTSPQIKKSGDLSYAVLATHNVISKSLDGWVAIDPAYFAKLSDIKVETPKAASVERYVLKEGKSIPKDKSGWVAVPFSSPEIIKSARDSTLAMAELMKSQIVSKEMNGWLAIDRETLGKLAEKRMMTGKGSDVSKTK